MKDTKWEAIQQAGKKALDEWRTSAGYVDSDKDNAYSVGFRHGAAIDICSAPVQICTLAYEKAWGATGKSWPRLNSGLYSILKAVITLGLEFQEDDIATIYAECNGGYWFGASLNCKHQGEGFYRAANTCGNLSAAKSFEKWRGRTPFLSQTGTRVSEGTEFKYQGLYWHVTGWGEENDVLMCAGYDNRSKEGKRKLKKFDREQWLTERENMTDFDTKSW